MFASKWGKFSMFAAAPVFVIMGYGLLPLSDDRFAITFDEERIERNRAFLNELAARTDSETSRPNVIILLADDLGKTDISHYGGTLLETPNIDAIGHRGVTFTDAYCTSPICSPSRAALMTGRYPQRFGFETQPMTRYARNRIEYAVYQYITMGSAWQFVDLDAVPRREDVERQGVPPSEITLAEILDASGYATGLVGKWHLGYTPDFYPTNRGFDYFYGFYEAFTLYDDENDEEIVNYRHDYFANKHIWRQQRKNHCAIRVNEKEIEEDDYLTFAIADEAVQFMERSQNEPFFLYVSFSAPHTPFQCPKSYYDRFAHIEDENKRVYAGMIAALDDAVGTIMDYLASSGLDENTLVWFASDNGGATYTGATENAPLKGGKFNFFEGGVNIPMMAQWKGVIPEGATRSETVTLMDIFATSIAAAKTATPSDVVYDGNDLLPYLAGDATNAPHDVLYWRAYHQKAVREGSWKLLVDDRTGVRRLYDLDNDRVETRNVAAKHPEVVTELEHRLADWQSELESPKWPRVMDYRFEFEDGIYEAPL